MFRRISVMLGVVFCLVTSGLAAAQGPMGHDGMGPGMGPGMGHDGAGPGMDGPPMMRAFHDRQFGRWWNDPKLSQQLGITDQQKKQMDQIFLQHRLNLIDLQANLEKQQVLLGPMIAADQPNETGVLAQIDKIAQARADLEKANARMLFDIRKTLTAEQWQKLKAIHEEHRMREFGRGPEGRGSPGTWREHHPGQGQGPNRPGGAAAAPPPQQGQTPAPPQ